MHASNDDNYTIFNEEDAQRAHRVSELPAVRGKRARRKSLSMRLH